MTAKDVLKLLAVKHAQDVFVPECKNGPTWSGDGHHYRLDAWAMTRSWANMVMTGYEVKISRSDFLNDDKWRAYLPLCNRFYFVAPRGIIQKEELPAEVGLLEVASTGRVLVTKRKAQHRDISPPIDLLFYIIMCRSKIGQNVENNSLDYWRAFYEELKEKKNLGHRISVAIQEHVSKVETENIRLSRINDQLSQVRELLKSLGVNPESSPLHGFQCMLRSKSGVNLDELKRSTYNALAAIRNIERLVKEAMDTTNRQLVPDGCLGGLVGIDER